MQARSQQPIGFRGSVAGRVKKKPGPRILRISAAFARVCANIQIHSRVFGFPGVPDVYYHSAPETTREPEVFISYGEL